MLEAHEQQERRAERACCDDADSGGNLCCQHVWRVSPTRWEASVQLEILAVELRLSGNIASSGGTSIIFGDLGQSTTTTARA